jgi:hypothetical protein
MKVFVTSASCGFDFLSLKTRKGTKDVFHINSHIENVVKPTTDDTAKTRPVKKPTKGYRREANTFIIRQKMIEPITKGGKEISFVRITDLVHEQFGIKITPDSIQRTIRGERTNERLQKAIARVLGLRVDEAFPKRRKK